MNNSSVKTLTPAMEELLMECHERELLKLEPHEAGGVKYAAKGLIERSLLVANFYTTKSNKKIMALFVTEAGRIYLNNFQKKPPHASNHY